MKKIEDLSEVEKEELSQSYRQRYQEFFDQLVKTMGELVAAQDNYGYLFVCEAIAACLHHASDRLNENKDIPPTTHGWPVGGIGDTVGEA
jgi:hypothetical protein